MQAPCDIHTWNACRRPTSLIDTTRTMRKDHSTLGSGSGRQGAWNIAFLTWAKIHITDKTPIIIHENVPSFDSTMLVEIFEPQGYSFVHFENIDAPHIGEDWSRSRRFDLAFWPPRARQLCDVLEVHSKLSKALQTTSFSIDDLFCETDEDALAAEIVRQESSKCPHGSASSSGQEISIQTTKENLQDWTFS